MDTDSLKRMNELIDSWTDFQKLADKHEDEMMAYRYQASLFFDQLNKEFPRWRLTLCMESLKSTTARSVAGLYTLARRG